jgi:hypothetical protein
LIVKNTLSQLWSFQGARGLPSAPRENDRRPACAGAPVSQNSAASDPLEVDVDLGEPELGRRTACHRRDWRPLGGKSLRDP